MAQSRPLSAGFSRVLLQFTRNRIMTKQKNTHFRPLVTQKVILDFLKFCETLQTILGNKQPV